MASSGSLLLQTRHCFGHSAWSGADLPWFGWCPRGYLLPRRYVLGSSFPTRRGQHDEAGSVIHIFIFKGKGEIYTEININFPDRNVPLGVLFFGVGELLFVGRFSLCISFFVGVLVRGGVCFSNGVGRLSISPMWIVVGVLFLGVFYPGGPFPFIGMFFWMRSGKCLNGITKEPFYSTFGCGWNCCVYGSKYRWLLGGLVQGV